MLLRTGRRRHLQLSLRNTNHSHHWMLREVFLRLDFPVPLANASRRSIPWGLRLGRIYERIIETASAKTANIQKAPSVKHNSPSSTDTLSRSNSKTNLVGNPWFLYVFLPIKWAGRYCFTVRTWPKEPENPSLRTTPRNTHWCEWLVVLRD